MMHTAEQIEKWKAALNEGRRKYYDLERRATYPANCDPDTRAIGDHYRLKYPRARVLKALSYFIDVPSADLSAVSGIHRALLAMEVDSIERHTGITIELVRARCNKVLAYRLVYGADRDEIRAVIQSAWHFEETFMPQSRGKKAA
jgi:hypothetical protein